MAIALGGLKTDLEEVQVAPESGAGCVVALPRRLADHNNGNAYQRCKGK